MFSTPVEAFTHVVDRLKRQNPALPVTRDYLLDVISPFLAHPEGHRESIDALLKLAELAGRLGATSAARRYFDQARLDRGAKRRRRRSGALASNHRNLTGHMLSIREDLSRSIRPAQISYDALPARRCPADATWQRHEQNAHEINLRIGVRALDGLQVNRVSIDMELNGSDAIHIVNAQPADSSEVVADRETTVTYSEKLNATKSGTAGLELPPVAGLPTLSLTGSRLKSHETNESRIQTRKDHATLQKVICVAVGSRATWDIYATPTQVPQGTLMPSVVFLVPSTLEVIEFVVRISVSVAGFDPVELEAHRRCALDAA